MFIPSGIRPCATALLVTANAGCGGTIVDATTHDAELNDAKGPPSDAATIHEACDPLAPIPTVLGGVIGVGRDASGTLFLAEQQLTSADRVFVSDVSLLRRAHVSGERRGGGGNDADYVITFQLMDDDASPGRALVIQVREATVTAMELGPAGSRDFITDASVGNERLAAIDITVLAKMKLVNLPRVVRNVVDAEDGTKVVITADMDDTSPSLFRLFYGRADDLVEHTITRFGQSRNGDGQIDFVTGGTVSSLRFYGRQSEGASLTFDDGLALSATHVLPSPRTVSGYSFRCLVMR